MKDILGTKGQSVATDLVDDVHYLIVRLHPEELDKIARLVIELQQEANA